MSTFGGFTYGIVVKIDPNASVPYKNPDDDEEYDIPLDEYLEQIPGHPDCEVILTYEYADEVILAIKNSSPAKSIPKSAMEQCGKTISADPSWDAKIHAALAYCQTLGTIKVITHDPQWLVYPDFQ